MSDLSCCFFCRYFDGYLVRGYCSLGFCLSDSGSCKLILFPCSQSCSSFLCAFGLDLDDLPDYDPSDPFGHFDPGFDDSLDDSFLVDEHFYWERD